LHTEQSGFGGKDNTSVLASSQKEVGGNEMLIDLPFEVDSERSWAPGRFPDSRIIELEQPSRGLHPVASVAPALRVYSGGAVPDFHRLPD
jgi:hypothetical protein